MPTRPPFEIGDHVIPAGTRETINLPVSVTSDHTPITLTVHVAHGRRSGPTMFVSAAIHGDEIIGVEMVRRLLRHASIDKLKGTLLVIPVVNSLGFMAHSRYLPDRRDLNRCFPGSEKGSLAARLANLFMEEIVSKSDAGIDIHSAAIHRKNLPQIRVSPDNNETMELARIFAAPLTLTSKLREGSLRHAAEESDTKVLLFEAGEGLRFDEFAVRVGVTGILRVMHHLGMIPSKGISKPKNQHIVAKSSHWLRAPAGGLLRTFKRNGENIENGDILGIVADPFGEIETEIVSDKAGVLIGRSNLPVVNEGDALFHIAKIRSSHDAEAAIDTLSSQLDEDPLFDEDEII